jgi:hypothetical protein
MSPHLQNSASATAPPSPPSADPAANATPPTFYGKLSIERYRRRAALYLTHRCPHCRGPHHHVWSLNAPAPTHRCPHCWKPRSPYRVVTPAYGYFIFPADTAENRRTLEEYAKVCKELGIDGT